MKAFIRKFDQQTIGPVFRAAQRHAEQAADAGAHEVVIRQISKSREQEEHYHALIGDIAKQYQHAGRRWKAEDMKRILVDAFKHDTIADEVNYPGFGELWKQMGSTSLAPALGRDGFVVLGEQTRRFPKKLACGFITWLHAFGAENGIVWSDPAAAQQMAHYAEAA